ncbi:MAG: TIGR03986 family CRISPR-associated RAMP protein [Rhodospirillum sp.]|nr:TIGR03986 family CRISPR-associated RAMP protein [Rhodospirillum sp.]MCF8492132.1 TIGR03986 family CRISPR-associated RAMP protein [Rhodospirillum sp.]MCF8501049.1 TIGR03986 family CRISPR-associated RAMP protein [Rhodospirillum sp.]
MGRHDFNNPYNFVPAPARPTEGPLADLGDEAPASHGHWAPDRISGSVTVTMTAVTPLLVPDSFPEEVPDHGGHESFDTRRDPRDASLPLIPPTSIKGMIRAAYEAATNSRFGVLTLPDRPFAYRHPPKVANEMIPARVDGDKIHLLFGDHGLVTTPSLTLKGTQAAARLPFGENQSHGGKRRADIQGTPYATATLKSKDEPNSPLTKTGYVYATGKNITRKKYERFFISDTSNTHIKDLTPDIKLRWNQLMEECEDLHLGALKERMGTAPPPDPFSQEHWDKYAEYRGDEPGQTAFSRHVYDKRSYPLFARDPASGTLQGARFLCYAHVRVKGQELEVVDLYPVQIPRGMYRTMPDALVPDDLKPARALRELSPADRVFGWVNPAGPGAYRGHLRVGAVHVTPPENGEAIRTFGNGDDTFPKEGLPLAILGQPRPQQWRFYASQNREGAPADHRKNYDGNRFIRGRKIYPHHKGLESSPETTNSHWRPAREDSDPMAVNGAKGSCYREYQRPGPPDGARDSQNRSIKSWVEPGTTLRFTLHLDNLSIVELGALLWLLDGMPDSPDPSPARPRHHRFGGGKPLGFGSVTLGIQTSDLRTGTQWKDAYTSFHDSPPEEERDRRRDAVLAFQAAVGALLSRAATGEPAPPFSTAPWIAALLQAAEGLSPPIHAPRPSDTLSLPGTPPKTRAENFKWFVANALAKGEDSILPSLTASDPRLPYRTPR